MQKPDFDERQWIMITPIVTDTIRYLLNLSDQIIKDNSKISKYQTTLNDSFLSDRDMIQNQLLKIITENCQINELTQSNASKIQHIYSICNHLEDRMAKSEARIENKLTELSNDLFTTLSTRTQDMMKMIEIRQAAVQTELQKQSQTMNLFRKDTDEKMNQLTNFITQNDQKNHEQQMNLYKKIDEHQKENLNQFDKQNEKLSQQLEFIKKTEEESKIYSQNIMKLQADYTQLNNSVKETKQQNNERIAQISKLDQTIKQLDTKIIKTNDEITQIQQQLIDTDEGANPANPTFSPNTQDDSDLIINKLRSKLQSNNSSTIIEKEILKQIKVYQQQKKFVPEDKQQQEQLKQDLMAQILESKLLNEQLVDEMLKIDYTSSQINELVKNKQKVQQIPSNQHSFNEFTDDSNMQVIDKQKLRLTNITGNANQRVKSRYEKLRQQFDTKSDDLQIDIEDSATTQEMTEEHSVRQNAIPKNKSEVYQMSLNPGTPRGDTFQGNQGSIQKNISNQINELFQRVDQNKQQQINDISDLKSFVEYRIQALILKQLNECGLGDFLQLDLKQMELQGEIQEVKQQLNLDDQENKQKGQIQDKNNYNLGKNVNKDHNIYYSSTIQMEHNNSLSFSNEPYHQINTLDIKQPQVPDAVKQNILSKNFQSSKIFQELRFELLKNLQIENEIVFTRFIKEISRVDGIIDQQSQEIVNVEERLRKLIKTTSSVGGQFRRSGVSQLQSKSKGIQISVSKPVMMIGYTGD